MTLQDIKEIIATYEYVPSEQEEISIGGGKSHRKLEYKDQTITFKLGKDKNGKPSASIEKGGREYVWSEGSLEYKEIQDFVIGI